MKRILASIPAYGGTDPLPLMHFLILSQHSGKMEAFNQYAIRWNVGGPQVRSPIVRNAACRFALQGGADYLLTIDQDMLPHPATIDKLISLDLPIVAPIFFRSGPPFDPLVFEVGLDGAPHVMVDYPVDQVFEALVGSGVMLIKTEVLAAMEDPWFYYQKNPQFGLDLDFCHRANQAGFKSYCDSSVLVQQMGLKSPVGLDQWKDHRETYGQERIYDLDARPDREGITVTG